MTEKDESRQLWIILLIVLSGFIGTSIAYPIFPPLFLHPDHGTIIPENWHQHARNIFLGLALGAYPLGQFFGSPILGGLSDRYGRKRVLILSLAGSIFSYFLTALSLEFNWIWGLLLSRFFTGMMEGNVAIVRAMATDLSTVNKYKSLGRINGMAALGFVMGPILGGLLSDNHIVPWFSFSLPFYLASIFSILCLLLAAFQLREKKTPVLSRELSIWHRFNLIKCFKRLFQTSEVLKYLLITSTIFTFAVDIFYEFGPVYLTGLFHLKPFGIAGYNAILSLTLTIGSVWLPHHLSARFSPVWIMVSAMSLTCLNFLLMILYPSPGINLVIFAIIGFSISVVNTNMTIKISNNAGNAIQGEALGTQLSLRMLGDALICFIGGFLIVSSVILPIGLSLIASLIALLVYLKKLKT